jgi:hypothetical protein
MATMAEGGGEKGVGILFVSCCESGPKEMMAINDKNRAEQKRWGRQREAGKVKGMHELVVMQSGIDVGIPCLPAFLRVHSSSPRICLIKMREEDRCVFSDPSLSAFTVGSK